MDNKFSNFKDNDFIINEATEDLIINKIFENTIIKKPKIKTFYKKYDDILDAKNRISDFNSLRNNYEFNIKILHSEFDLSSIKIPTSTKELISDYDLFYTWIDIIAVWRYFEVIIFHIKDKSIKNPLDKYKKVFPIIYETNKFWLKKIQKKYTATTAKYGNFEEDIKTVLDLAFLQALEQHGALIIGSPYLAMSIPFHKRLHFLAMNAARKEIKNMVLPFKKSNFFEYDENDIFLNIDSINI